MDWLTGTLGIGGGGVVLWILKKVPNETICKYVEGMFSKLVAAMTLGMSKWKPTKKLWNKTIEPWLIDLIDNIFGAMVRGLIKGLKSDK